MNADPTDTRYPHLDLGDLIAEAAGEPVGDRAREHLASCEHCQREANRWNLVAEGVRGLAAAAPETAQPARPRRTRRRVLAGPVAACHAGGRQRGRRARPARGDRCCDRSRARAPIRSRHRDGPHRGHRVHPARAGRRDARAGERQQPGHPDGQRPAGDRDHDGGHLRVHVRRRC